MAKRPAPSDKPTAPTRYSPSARREITRAANMARIEAAAWTIFATVGLDGATIRDIVEASGVSAGSFYNYYRTREAVFDVLVARLLGRVRDCTREARAQADTIEDMLRLSYRAFLEMLQSVEGAARFSELNQHHIRARLYSMADMRGILQDLEGDIIRVMPGATLPERDLKLIASIIVATGTEALLLTFGDADFDSARTADFVTRLMTRGIDGWGAEAVRPDLPLTPRPDRARPGRDGGGP